MDDPAGGGGLEAWGLEGVWGVVPVKIEGNDIGRELGEGDELCRWACGGRAEG